MSLADMAIFAGVAAVGYFIVAGVLNLFRSKRADSTNEYGDGSFPGPGSDAPASDEAGGWQHNRGRDRGAEPRPEWEPTSLEEERRPAPRGSGAFTEFDRRCSNRDCNESNAPDSQFCRRCGTRL